MGQPCHSGSNVTHVCHREPFAGCGGVRAGRCGPATAACRPRRTSGQTRLAAHGLLTSRSMARRTRRSLRGTALAEVGIIILPLVTISFAALDFAGILYTFLAVQNGVSQATRFAVTGNTVDDPSGAALARDQAIRQAMRGETLGFQIPDGAFTFTNVSKGACASGRVNLISRQVTIGDAEAALQTMSPVVRFDANSALILSVVRLGTGGANRDLPIIVERHSVGSFAGSSVLGNPPQSAYGAWPDYTALYPDTDGSIRVSGALPNGLTLTPGESVYVTEVFTQRTSIVPFMPLPNTLYASAYF